MKYTKDCKNRKSLRLLPKCKLNSSLMWLELTANILSEIPRDVTENKSTFWRRVQGFKDLVHLSTVFFFPDKMSPPTEIKPHQKKNQSKQR